MEQRKRARNDGERSRDVSLRNVADHHIVPGMGEHPPPRPWLDSELLKPQPNDSALTARSNCPYSSTVSLGMLQKPYKRPSPLPSPALCLLLARGSHHSILPNQSLVWGLLHGVMCGIPWLPNAKRFLHYKNSLTSDQRDKSKLKNNSFPLFPPAFHKVCWAWDRRQFLGR